jgi:hypothetical protein
VKQIYSRLNKTDMKKEKEKVKKKKQGSAKDVGRIGKVDHAKRRHHEEEYHIILTDTLSRQKLAVPIYMLRDMFSFTEQQNRAKEILINETSIKHLSSRHCIYNLYTKVIENARR